MKAFAIVVLSLAVLAAGGYLLYSGFSGTRLLAAEPQDKVLSAGTPVRLVLLKKLSSGGTDEGSVVPLMVADEVKSEEGTVLIKKGTIGYARVTKSRAAGTLSGLLNEPARLLIRFEKTFAVDGQEVTLATEPLEPESVYAFSRGNTGQKTPSQALDEMLKDPATREALVKMADMFARGEAGEFGKTPESQALVAEVAKRLNLRHAEELARAGELVEAVSLIKQLQSAGGGNVTAQTPFATALAVLELASVAAEVGDSLLDKLKGPNITAHVGTPVSAKVAKQVIVKVPSN